MLTLLILSSCIMGVGAMLIQKKSYHPIIWFELTWALILILYVIRLRPYIGVSEEALALLYIQMFLFPLGVIFGDYFASRYTIKRKSNNMRGTTELKEKAFFTITIVAAIFLLINDMVIIKSLFSGLSYYQQAVLGIGVDFLSQNVPLIAIGIVYPVRMFTSIICAVEYFNNNPKKKWYLIINIVIVVLSIIERGGRIHIMNFAICYLFAFLMTKNKKYKKDKQYKKSKWALFLLGIISFIGILVLTSSRNVDIGSQIYNYFSCSVPHMVARLETLEPSVTNGFFSLFGFFVPIFLILRAVGMVYIPQSYTIASEIRSAVEVDIAIGSGVRTNAFLPAVFYFYIDGGYIYAMVGMLLYGFIIGGVFRLIKRNKETRSKAIFLLFMIGVIESFTRFQFIDYGAAIALIYIFFLYRRSRIN